MVENFSEGDESRGYYVDGVIHLNAKKVSDSASVYVAIHEVVHHLKANNIKGYSVLEKYITNYLSKKGHNVDNMVKNLQRSRAKYGEKLSYEDALEELVCNTMSEIATDEEAMAVFLELNESERKTLISVLRDIANKIREWARSLTGKEYRRLVTESETLRHLANELNKQLKGMKIKENTANSGVRYSVSENTPLTSSDLSEYLQVGVREHVRSKKQKMISQGDSVILYTNAEIRQFISDSLDGKTRNSIKAYARVGTRFADELLKISDEDVAGYYLELDGNRIEHINDHVETDSDNRNIPLTDDEALEITEYINNYTEILSCVKRKDGSKRIYLSKVKPDGVVVVVQLISKGRSSIQPVTAWKNTVDAFNLIWGQRKKAINTSLVAKTATHRGYKIAFDNSISNSEETVKKNSYADELVFRAEEYFGTTRNWNETGYILTNGRQLDFSGKKLGAPGGERTVDHREILDSYDEETQNNMSGVEAMVDFMRQGNIRVMPETNGVNLSVLPNKVQERTLRDFISRANGEIILDIDNENGKTVVSVEYPVGTSSSKILSDIRQYFENGTEPYVSEVSKYRYSYADEEVDLWGMLEPEEETAESTQRSEYLEGFLDTSSVLLEKTRDVSLKEGRVREISNSVIRRYTGDYNTPLAQQVEDILTVATANQSVSGYDVVGEIAAVMKKAITESEYTVDQFRAEREDVFNIMRGYGKVYLNDEQIKTGSHLTARNFIRID